MSKTIKYCNNTECDRKYCLSHRSRNTLGVVSDSYAPVKNKCSNYVSMMHWRAYNVVSNVKTKKI